MHSLRIEMEMNEWLRSNSTNARFSLHLKLFSSIFYLYATHYYNGEKKNKNTLNKNNENKAEFF